MIARPFRVAARLLALLLLLLIVALVWLWPRHAFLPAEVQPFTVQRFAGNPVIAEVTPERGYNNINGPSVIRVPDWIENPLGRYYMYFAHHKGSYIRLAYADHPEGPWTVYEPGALSLSAPGLPTGPPGQQDLGGVLHSLWETFSIHVLRDYLMLVYRSYISDPAIRKQRGIATAGNAQAHIASPDVVVDQQKRRLLMYFHGFDERGGQSSRMAVSTDGIHFDVLAAEVFTTYLRGFSHGGVHYVLGMPGVLYRSSSLTGPFAPWDRLLFEPDMRHAGLWLDGDTLYVFWSRVGDTPERLLLSTVDLSPGDWNDWRATRGVELLRPEEPWEGADLPQLSSLRGELNLRVHEVRDPYLFEDSDGSLYLYYTGAGEQAIGVARLFGTGADSPRPD